MIDINQMTVQQYNIRNPGDETVFVIYSMKKLGRVEQTRIFEGFMKTRTYCPSRFRQEIVVFDDRPAYIR